MSPYTFYNHFSLLRCADAWRIAHYVYGGNCRACITYIALASALFFFSPKYRSVNSLSFSAELLTLHCHNEGAPTTSIA